MPRPPRASGRRTGASGAGATPGHRGRRPAIAPPERRHRRARSAAGGASAGTTRTGRQVATVTVTAVALYAMGERAEVAEVRLSMPNRHRFLVDVAPCEMDNPGEVFYE